MRHVLVVDIMVLETHIYTWKDERHIIQPNLTNYLVFLFLLRDGYDVRDGDGKCKGGGRYANYAERGTLSQFKTELKEEMDVKNLFFVKRNVWGMFSVPYDG